MSGYGNPYNENHMKYLNITSANQSHVIILCKCMTMTKYMFIIDLSVKICIGQSNKVNTSDKQMHVRFCDNICCFYFKIASNKLKRQSNRLVHEGSVALHCQKYNEPHLLFIRINMVQDQVQMRFVVPSFLDA